MANTGRVIVSSLKEVYQGTNTETGNKKSNIQTDPDYIAPYNDTTSCPIDTTISCPSTTVNKSTSTNYIIECQLPEIVTSFTVLVNDVDYTMVSGITVYENGNYLLIQFNNSTLNNPVLKLQMNNTEQSISLTCTLTY